VGQHLGGEASGQAVAGQGEQLSQMAQAHAGEGRSYFAGQAEALYRQRLERLA